MLVMLGCYTPAIEYVPVYYVINGSLPISGYPDLFEDSKGYKVPRFPGSICLYKFAG